MKKVLITILLLCIGFFIGYMYTGSDLFNKEKVSQSLNTVKEKFIDFFKFYEVKGFKND